VEYKYVSADNHMDWYWLPANLFQDRVPAKFKGQAPKIVETEHGTRWFWEGKARSDSATGKNNANFLKRFYPAFRFPAGTLPPATPSILLEHLDLAQIYAGIFYSDTRKWSIADRELRLAVYRAFNDFAMECNAVDPKRLMILPQIPTFAPDAALPELRRMLDRGAKAVEFSVHDVATSICSDAWDGVYDLASEAGVPLCTHIGDGAGVPYPPNENGLAFAHFSIAPMSVARYIPQFVFSGAFERFPKLQVSFGECRIGWLPFLISWMDRQIDVRPPDNIKLSKLPSEYVKSNLTFTFEEDRMGAKMLAHDWSFLKHCAVWGADYPHEQGTWPDPTAVLDEMLEGLDAKERRYVTCDHAARIFNVRMPAPAPV
jgi:predicted TIM-barrel fold metal-dependent hydrolase